MTDTRIIIVSGKDVQIASPGRKPCSIFGFSLAQPSRMRLSLTIIFYYHRLRLRQDFAINVTTALPPDVARYLQASVAENTRRAYQSDLEHFAQWGGAIPATPVQIASYLASHATTHKVATLRRRLAAIAKAHQDRQLSEPGCHPPREINPARHPACRGGCSNRRNGSHACSSCLHRQRNRTFVAR